MDAKYFKRPVSLFSLFVSLILILSAAVPCSAGFELFATPQMNLDTDDMFYDPIPYGGVAAGSSIPSADKSDTLTLDMVGDEYETSLFTVRSTAGNTANVSVSVSSLTQGANTIPAANIDVRSLLWWYQADKDPDLTNPGMGGPVKQWTPELLVHDDSLINSYNHTAKTQTLRFNPNGSSLKDATTLQTIASVPYKNLKQFAITVKTDSNVAPGTYTGTITVSSTNQGSEEIDVEINVKPYDHVDPGKTMAVWMPSTLQTDEPDNLLPMGGLASNEGAALPFGTRKGCAEYETDLELMQRYGVNEWVTNDTPDTKILPRKENAGITVEGKPYYSMDANMNWTQANLIDHYERTVDDSARDGEGPASELYIMLYPDEPNTAADRQAVIDNYEDNVEPLQDDGYKIKIFAALSSDAMGTTTHTALKDIIDVPLFKNVGSNGELSLWTATSEKVFGISYPLPCEEKNMAPRQVYGLQAWARNMDGVMVYDYQRSVDQTDPASGETNPWDDFLPDGSLGTQSTSWDLNMAYNVVEGDPVPTIQLWGFREAHDDVKLVSTFYTWLYAAEALEDLTQDQEDGITAARAFIQDYKDDMNTYDQDPISGASLGRFRRNAFIYTETFYNWAQAAQPTPEPATAVLLITGFAFTALRRKKNR